MTKPPLTVRNAAIATASVEIKTLTVSGKQVTLAVFRQLREVPLITDEGALAGQPWGIVNYHPDKCATGVAEHWHVVWQQGEDLRRSAVAVTPVFGSFRSSDGDRFMASCVHDLITTGTTPYFAGEPPLEGLLDAPNGHRVDIGKGFLADIALTKAGRDAAYDWIKLQNCRAAHHPDAGANVQWAEQRLAKVLPSFTAEVAAFEATTDVLYERYTATAAVTAERERRERHAQVRIGLQALPQLFIAV